MPTTYTVAIDFEDDGDFTDLGEVITSDVIALSWRLGMAQPYDSMAAPTSAQITLSNLSRSYSPEHADALQPGKRLRIQSDDGSTVRTHFIGFITRVEPQSGDIGSRNAVIYAHGPERQLSQYRVRLTAQVDVTADTVIAAILDTAPFRRAQLKGYWILDYTDHMELDTNTRLAEETVSRSLETGQTAFAYVGDTWRDGIPADEAIRQLVEAERGRFFTNRSGQLVFYNRHHLPLDSSDDATFEDDMAALEYAYGAEVFSGVQVTFTPRSVGAPGTVLWELESPQKLIANSTAPRCIVARFRDADRRPIGALTVIQPVSGLDYSANTADDGTGIDKTTQVNLRLISVEAGAAVLEIVNHANQTIYLQAGTRLRGTPLDLGDPITVEQFDPASLAFYGPQVLVFNLPVMSTLEDAVNLAGFELARRKDPRGVVRSIQVNAQQALTQVLTRTLFDRITVRETQTAHDAGYFIVGEEHEVSQGGTRHTVKWLLESADFSTFFLLDYSHLDQDSLLAY